MNIYAIRRDGYKFQELDLDVNDFVDDFPEEISYQEAHEFSRRNIALKGFWKLMRTGFSEISGQANLIPDVTPWIGASLLFSPQAHRFLGETLEPFGEFLPVVVDHNDQRDTYQIFNCLTTAEVFEEKSSDTELFFDESSVGDKLIFKSPFQHCIDIYCAGRVKELFESFQLKGVIFDERLGTFEE